MLLNVLTDKFNTVLVAATLKESVFQINMYILFIQCIVLPVMRQKIMMNLIRSK